MTQIQVLVSSTQPFTVDGFIFHNCTGSSPRISKRGKFASNPEIHGTFQWTSAVRALTLLFLSAKVDFSSLPGIGVNEIYGDGDSPACSLDYALSKQPAWLSDVFGCQRHGDSWARSFILRINPERRLKGPVRLTLQINILSAKDVTFLRAGTVLLPEELKELAANIVSQFEASSRSGSVSHLGSSVSEAKTDPGITTPNRFTEWESGLFNIFREEALLSLRHPLTLTANQPEVTMAMMASSKNAGELTAPLCKAFKDSTLRKTPAIRLGIGDTSQWIENIKNEARPLKVSIPVVHTGAQLLLRELRDTYKINLNIEQSEAHSTGVAERVVSLSKESQPDLLCLNVAAASWYLPKLQSRGYLPLMLMPVLSQRAQGGADTLRSKNGLFHLMSEVPSSASLYYDGLAETKFIDRRKYGVCETDLTYVGDLLQGQSEDVRIISPFPFYRMYEVYGVKYIDNPQFARTSGLAPTVLFANERFCNNSAVAESMVGLLRDTWLTLAEGGEGLDRGLRKVVTDKAFTKVLSRIVGFHLLQAGKPDQLAKPPVSWGVHSRSQDAYAKASAVI